VLTLVLGGVGCTASSPSSDPSVTTGPVTLAEVDDAIEARVSTDHLPGAALLVVRDGRVLRRQGYGSYDPTSVVPIASASKWLTVATLLTLVDEGRLSLDDPVRAYLPEFRGVTGSATIRQLLSHTSGIAQDDCVWDRGSSLQACATEVAARGATGTPGSGFAYGNTGFSVAGRIIEVVTGTSFEQAFEQRIAAPVGMTSTRFDGASYPTEANPVPAASAESDLDDYGRFVEMLAGRGVIDGHRILSEASVLEMEKDQVVGLDTHRDEAVRTTGIPTYGLGVWRDVVTADDTGVIVSGNGAYGFYPWIDRARDAYGVLEVYDQRGSTQAVPDSQEIVHRVWVALDDETGAPAGPATTTYGR
jgi:CubicO group peptidase (beta-lactamase class C family)